MKMSGNSSLAGAGAGAGAGAADESGLEPWRELFRGRDIYEVIGNAIRVAATDSPQEFRRRRDGIVEQIYTAPTVPIPQGRAAPAPAPAGERSGRALEVSDKASKVASCTAAPAEAPEDKSNKNKGIAVAAAQHANGEGGNADRAAYAAVGMESVLSLYDQMDADSQEINEVLRIKDILLNHHEQSADILFDSLRRLQLMHLTADKIKLTEIGVAVTAVSKHKSHKIRMLVHEIVKDWKATVDDWIAATKATMDSDSNKHMDISNTITAEDEGGLATPPMDIGALYLVSHATEIQSVSEFLQGMDDDERTTTNLSKDKGGGCRPSNSGFDGLKPSNSTTPWTKDPIIVQALPVPQGPLFDNRGPQKLQARKRRLSRNTSPPVTHKNTQEEGSHVPRLHIKVKHSCTECAPRGLVEKKHYEENQGTVTRISPIIAARELPPCQVLKKEMPTQSSAGPKVGTSKRNVRLTEMDIDATKRKLRGAYQEAENSKQRRAIQIVELCDIAKSRHNHVVSRTPSMKSMDLANRTHTMNRSQIIKSWENDQCK